jgi:hypothetical protein
MQSDAAIGTITLALTGDGYVGGSYGQPRTELVYGGLIHPMDLTMPSSVSRFIPANSFLGPGAAGV